MNCMKCGREIAAEQVFCEECLTEMKKYPVKPGTAVQLPWRKEASVTKKAHPRRKTVSMEEQVKRLRRTVWILASLLLAALVLLAVLAYPVVKPVFGEQEFLPGQNYSSITTTEAGTEPDVSRETADNVRE